jgi:hypothetical protein
MECAHKIPEKIRIHRIKGLAGFGWEFPGVSRKGAKEERKGRKEKEGSHFGESRMVEMGGGIVGHCGKWSHCRKRRMAGKGRIAAPLLGGAGGGLFPEYASVTLGTHTPLH